MRAIRSPGAGLGWGYRVSYDLLDTIKHGSHLILVGRVIQLQSAELAPLTYLNGAYCQVVPQRHNLENINAHHTR